MSLRRSILFLSLAFAVLVAIVIGGLSANAPAGKLQSTIDQRRAPEAAPDLTAPATMITQPDTQLELLPDLRIAPRRCADPLNPNCTRAPSAARPATFSR